MVFGSWTYIAIFLGSAALSWLLTPLALKIAVRQEIFDRPRDYKTQASPVPYLGGAAIMMAFAIAILIGAVALRPGAGLQELPWIIGLAIALSVTGLIDDIRGLTPYVRFIIQIAAGTVLWFVGVQVLLFDNGALNFALTILWIVGITNAFNLLDNMDGLSAGVAAIASFGFFLIAAMNGQFLVAALAIALAGCSAGFLRHNFHPAKIYMGDAGSLLIGFLLAVIGIKLRFEGPVEVTFMVPIMILALPLFDTTLVVVTRLLHRRNPLSGGRDHTSHRLIFVGIPVRSAVGLIYLATLGSSWLALVLSRIDVVSALILFAFVLTLSIMLGFMLGAVPVYETSKRRRMVIRAIAEHEDPADLRQAGEPAPAVVPDIPRIDQAARREQPSTR